MYKKHHFHFVGINGIGMSGIAKILLHQGHTISGCDLSHDRANIQELLDAKKRAFRPSIPNLVYQYSLYSNYESEGLLNKNPEIPDF